jgi:hypothetical protein
MPILTIFEYNFYAYILKSIYNNHYLSHTNNI